MKKIILILSLLVSGTMLSRAQTVYWFEDFSFGGEWILDDNWHISDGKLHFNWYPMTPNFDLEAVSPPIHLIDNAEKLIVKQYLEVFGSSNPPEVAEISLIVNGEDQLLWSHGLDAGHWGSPGGSDIEFDIAEFAGETVQFKFRTHGPVTWQWSAWDVHEIKLIASYPYDLAAYTVTGPSTISEMETGNWSVEVMNLGTQPQHSFAVSLISQKFGDLVGTIQVDETILPQQSLQLDFEWTPDFAHNTLLYAQVSSEQDDFNGNDISDEHFLRVGPSQDFSVLLWNNDNGINTVVCPDQGDLVRPTVAMMRVLNKAAIPFQLVNNLPGELLDYDLIIASLGCYCLS